MSKIKLNLIRRNDWLFSFIPLVIGFLALASLVFNITLSLTIFFVFVLFTVSSVGIAALGYFINEYYDIETDCKAKKHNFIYTLSHNEKSIMLLIILLLIITPWFYLNFTKVSLSLIVIEIILFIIYSFPLIRLKNVLILSNVIDTLYAYVIPFILSVYTISLYSNNKYPLLSYKTLIIALILFSLSGFKNILEHQYQDRNYDKRIGVKTLGNILTDYSFRKVIQYLLIVEVVFTFFLIINIVMISKNFYLMIFASIYPIDCFLYYVLKQEINFLTFSNFLNKLHQLILPILCFSILITIDVFWSGILIGFLMMYYKFLPKANITSKIFVLIKRIIQMLGKLVNYCIYYTFRIFNVNLIKENKSAMQYLREKLKKTSCFKCLFIIISLALFFSKCQQQTKKNTFVQNLSFEINDTINTLSIENTSNDTVSFTLNINNVFPLTNDIILNEIYHLSQQGKRIHFINVTNVNN